MYFKDRIGGILQLLCREKTFIEKKHSIPSTGKRIVGFIFLSVHELCYLYCKRNKKTKQLKYLLLQFLFFPISSHLEEFKVWHVRFIVGEDVIVVLFPACVRLQRERKG